MEFETIDQYESVMEKIEAITESLTVLGVYKKGKTIK
jgi:prephenate dehydratase